MALKLNLTGTWKRTKTTNQARIKQQQGIISANLMRNHYRSMADGTDGTNSYRQWQQNAGTQDTDLGNKLAISTEIWNVKLVRAQERFI